MNPRIRDKRVKFDDATSDALANACRTVAQNIDNAITRPLSPL